MPSKYQKYFDLPERKASFKIAETGATVLGQSAKNWLQTHAGRCGLYRLYDGPEALSTRLALIDAAECSIDIQSYLIRDDLSGNLIALRLVAAADRGVRVRLLMDDALTHPIDTGLLSLNDHINIEVRVFNPFPRRRSRFISFIANFNVLNRRMHNKSFTVDNQVTIVGGRNIADEYFETGGKSEFLDEDLLAIGAVVNRVSDGFDEYWNMPEAIPVNVFGSLVRYDTITDVLESGKKFVAGHKENDFLREVAVRVRDHPRLQDLDFCPADADMVMDDPEKVRSLIKQPASKTYDYLLKMAEQARDELIIISPYFVPQKRGVDFFARLVSRGVRVVIVTNSLASTNHASVHAVYARYRKPLLQQGVELYELRPGFDERVGTKTTLHSKVSVVDRARLFVGSFNLDPRSLYINTEMGLAAKSVEMATQMSTSFLESLSESTYRLSLSDSGQLLWRYPDGNGDAVATVEPHAGRWRRIKTWLMSFLPIEGQM
ncbi:MAG: phospholipase D family protein [Gammaproteobacteria bacterium]|nr:phospholipase D family protein [Gammaproteobacteria bacterium]